MSRRRFLKLAAVAGGVGFGLARHYGIFNTGPKADFDYDITESDRRPKADFEYKTPERTLSYINPNSAEEILFFPRIVEDDLSYSWFIDSEPVAETTDYSTKLKAGEHIVKLYVKESDERFVELLNKSYDPDALLHPLVKQLFGISDNLRYEWNIDSKKMSSERDYSLKLSSGEHKIGLKVSDDRKQGYTEKAVTIPEGENFAVMQKVIEVDPDELYPERKLGIPIKGINYHIGRRFIGYYGVPPTELEMEEALTIIRNELGCNAIKIYGDYEDLMITCAKKSFDKNFKTIILSPRYSKKNPSEDMDIEGHIENIIEFSKIAENLRKKSDSIILSVGDELTISVRGITGGLTYEERVKEMKDKWTDITYQNKLNLYLKKIIKGVRENFKGKITYASAGGERFGINWDDLDFDIIGPHYYIAKEWYTKEEMIKTLLSYKKYNKPIYITEFGCSSYEGASRWGGGGFFNYTNQKYSQKEQAQTIEESIKVYEQAHVDGIFLWEFIERFGDDAKSLGIIKYNEDNPMERKLGFYMYKSYQTL